MRKEPEQLSFWNQENQRQKIEPNKVEIDNSQIPPIVKVFFNYQNDKGVIIEIIFTFEGSIKKFNYSKTVVQSPEGLRTFTSEASLEENTWIDNSTFKIMKRRAIAIANDQFQKLTRKSQVDNKQLKLFD